MPTNKNAYIRYQALDKCFRDRLHRYYIDDLIDKCEDALLYYNGVGGVSRRQIFEDIKFMESDTGWSIPLERRKDGKKVYYRYKDSNFSINKQPITDEEAQQLRTVILTLSRFRGFPSNEWVEDVISNLEWRFHLRGDGNNIIGFEQNDKLRGLGWLSMCIDAISNHQAIRIVYRNYKNRDREIRMVAHPWYVKQYNNRWFLFGLNEENHSIHNIALDRIEEIDQVNREYIPTDIDFERYLDDVVGVSVSASEKLPIQLQFSEHRFPYVLTKALHRSQRVVDLDNRIVEINVIPNNELEALILSFGKDVEVLSPLEYRKQIQEVIRESYEHYLHV